SHEITDQALEAKPGADAQGPSEDGECLQVQAYRAQPKQQYEGTKGVREKGIDRRRNAEVEPEREVDPIIKIRPQQARAEQKRQDNQQSLEHHQPGEMGRPNGQQWDREHLEEYGEEPQEVKHEEGCSR